MSKITITGEVIGSSGAATEVTVLTPAKSETEQYARTFVQEFSVDKGPVAIYIHGFIPGSGTVKISITGNILEITPQPPTILKGHYYQSYQLMVD